MASEKVILSSAQIVSTAIVAPLGTVAIAANSFAITAESLCDMPAYGIQMCIRDSLVGCRRGIFIPNILAGGTVQPHAAVILSLIHI